MSVASNTSLPFRFVIFSLSIVLTAAILLESVKDKEKGSKVVCKSKDVRVQCPSLWENDYD